MPLIFYPRLDLEEIELRKRRERWWRIRAEAQLRLRKGPKAKIELWPETGESREDFLDRCVGALAPASGKDKAAEICEAKWTDSEKVGKKSLFDSRVNTYIQADGTGPKYDDQQRDARRSGAPACDVDRERALDRRGHLAGSSWYDRGGLHRALSRDGLVTRQPGHDVSDEPRDESGKWTEGGGDGEGEGASFRELSPATENKSFHAAISAAKTGKFAAAVHVYSPAEYRDMRLFLAKDGKSGFAIHGDDAVSLFKHPSSTAKGVADAALREAVANGARRLDAFDTVLPRMYSKNGFRAVARLKWNDKFAPKGWDKNTFKDFNKGEPDVVFMVHDPAHAGKYKAGEGKRVSTYDEGKAEQDKALAKIHSHPGEGYSKDSWVDQKGVIHTNNVNDAARALYENKKVELHQAKQVSTLIQKLGQEAKRWQAAGQQAPVFNLCNVSVEGTNLFCAESKGIPRVEMPVIPAKRTKDFIKYLRGKGYDVEKDTERADHLRATQSEISGAKVAASMDRIEKEGFYKRLVVSRDDYILDGHHTWAGEIGLEAKKGTLGDEKTVKIARVNISITKLIDEADKWMAKEGLAKKPASEAAKTLGEVIREWIERQPGHDVSDEPRDEGGRWTEGGGDGGEGGKETGGDKESASMRLVGTGVDRQRVENWRKDLEGQLDKLEKEGKAGAEEWDKINRMEISLGFYLNASERDRANGHASLNEVHDGNNKLLATVFTQFNPKNKASVIEGIGGLEKAALTKALEHAILHEREGNKSERIEKVEFADNADTIAAMEAAGFRQEKMQAEGVVRMIHGAKETSAERALPEFGDYPINVIMPKGLSRGYQAEVAGALDMIPAPAMKAMADAGVTLHSGRNLTTIFPDLHDKQPRGWSAGGRWDQAEGMFDPETVQVVTTEFYRNSKGELTKGGRTQGVVLHESGHAFDYANGTPSDNSPSFVAAYREDHEKIPEQDRRNSRLSYYTPEGQGHGETEAIKYLNAARAARSETFAEIFAWTVGQQGSQWEDIRKDFPRVTAMMKQAVKSGRMSLRHAMDVQHA